MICWGWNTRLPIGHGNPRRQLANQVVGTDRRPVVQQPSVPPPATPFRWDRNDPASYAQWEVLTGKWGGHLSKTEALDWFHQLNERGEAGLSTPLTEEEWRIIEDGMVQEDGFSPCQQAFVVRDGLRHMVKLRADYVAEMTAMRRLYNGQNRRTRSDSTEIGGDIARSVSGLSARVGDACVFLG